MMDAQSERIYALLNSLSSKTTRDTFSGGRQVTRFLIHTSRDVVETLLASCPEKERRKIDRAQVAKFKRKALSGRWAPELGDILVSRHPNTNIELAAGNHRLSGVLEAYLASPLFRGVDMYVTITTYQHAAIESNEARSGSLADHLTMSDDSEFDADTASAASAVIRIVTGRMFNANGINGLDTHLEVALANMIDIEIKDADTFIKAKTGKLLSRAYLLFTHAMMSMLGEREAAERYVCEVLGVGNVRGGSAGQFVANVLAGRGRKIQAVTLEDSKDRCGLVLYGALKELEGRGITQIRLPEGTSILSYSLTTWRNKLEAHPDGATFLEAVNEAVLSCRSTKMRPTKRPRRRERSTSRLNGSAAKAHSRPLDAGEGAH